MEDRVFAVVMDFQYIAIAEVEYLNQLDREPRMCMVMTFPSLPQDFADALELVPMARLIVRTAHIEHCVQGIGMADVRLLIERGNDLLIVLRSSAMSVISAQRTEDIECADGQSMVGPQIFAILNKKLLIDLNYLVPVTVLLVELDQNTRALDHALVVNMARSSAGAIYTDVYLLGFMKMVRMMMAHSQAKCDFDSSAAKVSWQGDCSSVTDDRPPHQK